MAEFVYPVPTTSGGVLDNDTYYQIRNAADDTDIDIFKLNSSDQLVFDTSILRTGTPQSGTVNAGEYGNPFSEGYFQYQATGNVDFYNTFVFDGNARYTFATGGIGALGATDANTADVWLWGYLPTSETANLYGLDLSAYKAVLLRTFSAGASVATSNVEIATGDVTSGAVASGNILLTTGATTGTRGYISLSALYTDLAECDWVIMPSAGANPSSTDEGAMYAYSSGGTYNLRVYLNGGWRSVALT